MEKKLFILFIFTLSLCFSEDLNSIYKKAKELEYSGDYKSAMLLYKKIANESLKNPSLDKSEDLVIKEIKKEPKKEFFEHNIDKSKDKDTNDNLEQLVTKDFGIYPYKKNYFLPATYTFNNISNRDNFETSFQISLEKPISNDFFGLNETISIAYTQKSFWQTASSSAPFRETNYEPEIFMQIPNDDKYLKLYKTSFLHTSNGKGGDDSRSLNRLSILSVNSSLPIISKLKFEKFIDLFINLNIEKSVIFYLHLFYLYRFYQKNHKLAKKDFADCI